MPQPPVQMLLTFALGAAAWHGGWLSALFFLKKNNRLLGVALASVSVFLLNYLLFLTEIIRQIPGVLGWLFPFIFLAGAAFYFFVKKSLVPGFLFRRVHLLHLLPFAYGWWQMWPIFSMPPERKKAVIEWLLSPGEAMPMAEILKGNIHIFVLLGYAVAAWIFCKKIGAATETLENGAKAKWYQRFSAFFIGLLLLDLAVKISFNLLGIPAVAMEYLLAGMIAVSVHLVGWHALGRLDNFPKILPETPQNGKYKTSPLDAPKLDAAKLALLQLMETEKPFLDPDLKIASLAARLGIPSHHLSQVLNEKIGLNFNDFVNGYRVEEAKNKLVNPLFGHFSVEAIGWESGFANKTTFNRAFKKMTGRSPGEFMERPT